MQDKFHKAAVLTCRILLKPIITLLLRYGLAYKEFSEIAKHVYVDVAGSNPQARKNHSYISVKTGISRKEIKKVLSSTIDPFEHSMWGVIPIRVMSLWFSLDRFTDVSGQPLSLPLTNGQGPSLSELIDHVSVDVPATTVIKELISSGAVVERGGNYMAKSRQFLFSPLRAESIIKGGFVIAALADTVVENLSKDRDRSKLKFQRSTFSLRVSTKNARIFQEYMNSKAEKFLEKMDNKLTRLEDTDPGEKRFSTGMGIYYFRKELEPEISNDVIDRLHV